MIWNILIRFIYQSITHHLIIIQPQLVAYSTWKLNKQTYIFFSIANGQPVTAAPQAQTTKSSEPSSQAQTTEPSAKLD